MAESTAKRKLSSAKDRREQASLPKGAVARPPRRKAGFPKRRDAFAIKQIGSFRFFVPRKKVRQTPNAR